MPFWRPRKLVETSGTIICAAFLGEVRPPSWHTTVFWCSALDIAAETELQTVLRYSTPALSHVRPTFEGALLGDGRHPIIVRDSTEP